MTPDSPKQQIINELKENARTPYAKIAKKVGLCSKTVRKHMEEMEKNGTILGYSVDLNPSKIPYNKPTIIGIDTESDKYLTAANELKKLDPVTKLYISTGDYKIIAEVVSDNHTELEKIIKKQIQPIEGIKKAHPSILTERMK